MKVVTRDLELHTKGESDILNITEEIANEIESSKIGNGVVTIFVKGSTAALTTIEYEPGLKQDFPAFLERIAPRNIEYQHERTWHDGNGHSHVRASLIGPSLTVPIVDGRLTLGVWQQIVVLEFDTRSRVRTLVTMIMGE
ncbi:MAG TPA: secondary thiamine-phosphate synthase enzyme YjbQ [Candidatus Bathyarchaeia archaeon]|nr:MAG: secondary thiamine-phosphate synthase enzyme [Candidatus Bathyarchaeota archaeon RBG_16_48_13]HJX23359.1 secondary thiamine-phosphate synthase enzyme YjbQ [Candidatus Bathyarchaeia archaeon]